MKENIGKLVITLTVIGIVSALILAFVYQWTLPQIQAHQAEEQKQAIFAVLPGAVDYKKVENDGKTFFEGFDKSGTRVGIAQKVSGPGFQGIIELMVGVDPDSDKIYGIRILAHEETPGLGANIEGEKYRNNFKNKQFADYNVVKREAQKPTEVEAIAGATISSLKVTEIVEKAITSIKNSYGGEN